MMDTEIFLHSESDLECTQCHYHSNSLDDITHHISIHHCLESPVFFCKLCGFCASGIAQFEQHVSMEQHQEKTVGILGGNQSGVNYKNGYLQRNEHSGTKGKNKLCLILQARRLGLRLRQAIYGNIFKFP